MASVIRRKREQGRAPHLRQAILQRHLTTLQLFRAVGPYGAFVWPEDVHRVHSVIDHTYGLAAEELPDTYLQAVSRLEHHTSMIESCLEEGT